MASIEEVIMELKRLSPEQVDQVARLIRGLARADPPEAPRSSAIPAEVVDGAVQHGWSMQLFTELIGALPNLERADQPPVENRTNL